MNFLVNLVQKTLHPFGVEVRRLPQIRQKRQLKWLIEKQIQTVIDIGANTGQFSEFCTDFLPDAMIYAFEPLPDCYQTLVTKFDGKRSFQAFNIALGNENQTIKMNRNNFSPSSSILEMTDLHKNNYPFTEQTVTQEVFVRRLDDLVSELQITTPLFIKVDVQGFEDRVIEGGVELFKQASVILIEMSIEKLYEGQLLFDDIYRKLTEMGFRYQGNYAQSYSIEDGRVLHLDGFFVK